MSSKWEPQEQHGASDGILSFNTVHCADPSHALRGASVRVACEEPKVCVRHRDGRSETVHRYTLPWAVCAGLNERGLRAVERFGPQSWSEAPLMRGQASSTSSDPRASASPSAAPPAFPSVDRSIMKREHNLSSSSKHVGQKTRRLASSELPLPFWPPSPSLAAPTEREVQTSTWVEAQCVNPLLVLKDPLYAPRPSQPFCFRPKSLPEQKEVSEFAKRSMRVPTLATFQTPLAYAKEFGAEEAHEATCPAHMGSAITALKDSKIPDAEPPFLIRTREGEKEKAKEKNVGMNHEGNRAEEEAVSIDHDEFATWVSIEQGQPPSTLNDSGSAVAIEEVGTQDGEWEMVQAEYDESDDDDELCVLENEV